MSSPVVLYCCVADHHDCPMKRFEVMYSGLGFSTKFFIKIDFLAAE